MALITCPECNGQVSDKADVCPHCGYPIAANTPQEKYAFCVKSQLIPTSTVQAWERFTALRLTMEIAGVSTGDAEKMLSTPGSILKDKLTEQEAAAVVLNYQRLHIPTAVEQSNYTLREVEQEKQEAQEAFFKKRAAENPDELFVFKKVWPAWWISPVQCAVKISPQTSKTFPLQTISLLPQNVRLPAQNVSARHHPEQK